MSCALGNTKSNTEKVSKGRSSSISSERQNIQDTSKDDDVSACFWLTEDQRYLVLSYNVVENDSFWRYVVPIRLPQDPAERNSSRSETNHNTDGLNLVSPPPTISSEPNVTRKSRNRRKKKGNEARNSQKNSFLPTDISDWLPPGTNVTTNSTDQVKSSKKKLKKKKKQRKKSSKLVRGSSVTETCANSDIAKEGPVLGHQLAEINVEGSDSEENSSLNVKQPETPKTVISYNNGLVPSVSPIPSSIPEEFSSDDSVTSAVNEIENTEHAMSSLNKELVCTHPSTDISSETFSDAQSAPFTDSISDEWNSYGSTNAGDDAEDQSSVKEKNDFSYGFDEDRSPEIMKYREKDCSRNDLHSDLPEKMDVEDRNLSENSSSIRKLSLGGNVSGVRIGKENHSIWQKVDKNDVCDGISDSNASSVGVKIDSFPNEAPFCNRVSNVVGLDEVAISKDDSKPKVRVSENVASKPITGTKQEFNYYSKMGPSKPKMLYKEVLQASMQVNQQTQVSTGLSQSSMIKCNPIKTNVPKPTTMKMIYKEVLSGQVRQQNGLSSKVNQTSMIDCHDSEHAPNSEVSDEERKVLDVCPTASHQIDCIVSEPVPKSEICKSESNALEIMGATASDTNSKILRLTTSELVEQKGSPPKLSQVHLHLPVTEAPIEQQTEVSRTESINQDHSSRSILEKCLPVMRKDSSGETDKSKSNNLLVSLNKSVSRGSTLNLAKTKLNPNADSFVPLKDAAVTSGGLTSAILKNPPPRNGSQVENFSRFITEERSSKNAMILEIESVKIAHAVSDAYRMEMASTGFHLATGKPLAQFETLLHSVSPVLGQTGTLHDCLSCSTDRSIGASLCRHEFPYISLGRLWRWYEKHASFGLEVKIEDHLTSKRTGIGSSKFSAYYVPFLSAVQLFGNSRSSSNFSSGFSSLKASGKYKNGVHLPISSLPGEDDLADHSLNRALVHHPELLFEYYELEQPFKRKPLFDKIKEVVGGGELQNCRTYGDRNKLVYMNLHDLHPASWYSVAWYPIYRIPQGNLHGAFLTYHSLGHFVRRRSASDSHGISSIVSPVVGLQSYNAQNESWFKLEPSFVTLEEEDEKFNRAEILKERLRTLEKTSYVMARAVINKGNQNYMNKQQDFEFFVSRRRS